MATPNEASGENSLEGSMLRSPWLTICNVVWGNRLAASPHTIGSRPISFSSLWPGQNFLELYQHGRMENSLYDIVKLLLASSTYAPFDELLANGILTWETKFPGDVTLTHLVCAFNSIEGCNRLLRDAPPKSVWEMKDHLNNDPFSICFSPNLRKNLRKNIKNLNNKHNKAALSVDEPLTPQIRSQIFNLASEAEGLYYLTVLLQLYEFDINEERDDNGNMLIHVAASGGLPCLSHIFYLVDYCRADITQPNRDGLTPLHIAAMIGDEKLTEVLICVFGMGVNSCDIVKKWTPLHFAARYNRPGLIDMLLERGADLRKDDIDGCIPSLVAQKYSSIECLNLLDHHTKKRDNILLQQATEGTLEVYSLYPSDLALVSDSGFTLLMKAVLGNQPVLVRKLLSQPSCPKDFKQFKLPSPNGLPSITDQSKKTALIMAAENGLLDCLRILLEEDADPTIEDCNGLRPLHFAVDNNHKDCVRCILSHPKGLNGLKLAVSLAEKNGRGDIAHVIREAMVKRHKEVVTPSLFKIAQSGEKDELFHLLEDGDDVNPTNDVSDWPLYVASAFGNVEIIKLLSEAGGHVVKRHRLNLCTPLHVAARGGHAEVIRFLLGFCSNHSQTASDDHTKAYLDINEKNAMQETPLELAVCQGHMKVVRLLLDHGAVTTLPDSNSSLLSCPAFCGVQFLIESRRKEQMDKIVRSLKDQVPLKEFSNLWKGPSDFNLRDGHGDTVLMVAAKYAKPDVMDFLLQSAVLYTADMRITWNYNKRAFKPIPVTSTPLKDGFEESLPSELPSRMRDDYLDYRPHTASVLETSLGSRYSRPQPSRGRVPRGGGGYMSNDTSEDDDTSLSGSFNARYTSTNPAPVVPASHAAAPTVNERPSAYMNVVLKGNGPCTQSGLLCLINTYDRCSVLHRAVEGNQFKLIPLLLAADPNIVDLQDKNGQSALHRACQNNHKKCIQALCTSPVVSIDPLIRDVNNKVAEDLVIQPRLKKLVNNYRVKYAKENHPRNRPLPPAPDTPQSHDTNGDPPRTPPRVSFDEGPQLSPITPHHESDHVTHRSPSYQYTRLNHQPPNPSNPIPRTNHPPPTIEEQDSSYEEDQRPNPTPSRRQPQPRYITHNPRGNNGAYNRVRHNNGGNVHANGIVSDDGGYYSRLNRRSNSTSAVPPLPNQPRIDARANEIRRNLTFEITDSMMSSD